jgi:hypothetical protein
MFGFEPGEEIARRTGLSLSRVVDSLPDSLCHVSPGGHIK